MAKRNSAALVGVLVCALLSGSAVAAEVGIKVDGCAKLARAVYSEVSAAALYGPGKSGPWLIDSGSGEIAMCTTTAKTVSRAFTSAMRNAGFDVNWKSGMPDPGDFCLSHYISQCYPDRGERFKSHFGSDSVYVQRAWSVVSQSVMQQMHNPFSSDEVRFQPGDLKLQLGLSLRTIDTRETLSPHLTPNRR